MRFDSSGSDCASLEAASTSGETCVDVTDSTKLLYSKEANSLPLAHFKVEEYKPCADGKFISSAVESHNPTTDNLYQVNEFPYSARE